MSGVSWADDLAWGRKDLLPEYRRERQRLLDEEEEDDEAGLSLASKGEGGGQPVRSAQWGPSLLF